MSRKKMFENKSENIHLDKDRFCYLTKVKIQKF